MNHFFKFSVSALAGFFLIITNMTAQSFQKQELNTGWMLKAADTQNAAVLPASVPGVVQQDLIAYGLMPDPFYGANEGLVQWVGEKTWEYHLSFQVENYQNKRNYELVFEGLDTYASVSLNGKTILTADNMFRTWKVNATSHLQEGINELVVRFEPPSAMVKEQLAGLPYHLTAGNDTGEPKMAPYARKAQYQFGWDWGLRLVTAGIWRGVSLNSWEIAKLEDVQYYQQELSDEKAILDVKIDLKGQKQRDYKIVVRDADTDVVLGQTSIRGATGGSSFQVEIANPKRWWPNGQGEAFRYQLQCELWHSDEMLDSRTQFIGLRTIELIQQPDKYGESFYFKVNGRAVFMKGASYIPKDVMIPRVTEDQKRDLLTQCKDANMNLVRIWGGGIYEDDFFYEMCDSLGLLVWQDFMFACAAYPGDADFLENIEIEIRQNVRRLRNHPSVLTWCGNNEVYMAWLHWGWKKMMGKDSAEMFGSYEKVFQELIPEILADEDPGRPYTHTSPLGSWGKASGFTAGTMHYWGVWHGPHDFSGYDSKVGRYMNEYGFQSFPDMETIRTFADSSQWALDSPVMDHHQKSYIGNGLIGDFTEKYGDPADDFEGFVEQSQIVQYEGMRRAIAAHRLRRGYCMGTTFWQLNDCWPGPSWSAIDYYGRPKVLFEELGNLYAPIAFTVAGTKRKPRIALMSDYPEAAKIILDWQRTDETGRVISSGEMMASVDGAGTQLLPVPAGFMPKNDGQNTTVKIEIDGEVWSEYTWKGRYDPMPLPEGGIDGFGSLIGE